MDNYFDREIMNLEKELTYLKSNSKKSGGIISFFSTTLSLNIPLQHTEDSSAGGYGAARALKYYQIIPTVDPSIIIPTLDWYYQDVSDPWYNFSTRRIEFSILNLPNGQLGVRLYFIGTEIGSNSDAARTKRGESVVVNVKITATATSQCTITEYRP